MKSAGFSSIAEIEAGIQKNSARGLRNWFFEQVEFPGVFTKSLAQLHHLATEDSYVDDLPLHLALFHPTTIVTVALPGRDPFSIA